MAGGGIFFVEELMASQKLVNCCVAAIASLLRRT
jgi:hypothetical protein